jgi:hypothetical protein
VETIILQQPIATRPGRPFNLRLVIAVIMSTWLLLVVSLGATGAFVGRPGMPPVAIGIAVAAPLVLFSLWLRLSQTFREFVLCVDLRLIAAMQAWRWAGLGFLSLYAHKILPAVFALPAGLGDMSVGIAAPWMVIALVRRPGFAASRTFVRWNIFGILDLLVAIAIGTVGATLATGAAGEISTAPLASLPLLLIPAFLVPFFLILHAAALMQSRRLRASRS